MLPLNEVNKITKSASKPGNLVDRYIKVQDINNAVHNCKEELKKDFGNEHIQKIIFDIINKWLLVNPEKKEKEYYLLDNYKEPLVYFTIKENSKEEFKKMMNWNESNWNENTKVKE